MHTSHSYAAIMRVSAAGGVGVCWPGALLGRLDQRNVLPSEQATPTPADGWHAHCSSPEICPQGAAALIEPLLCPCFAQARDDHALATSSPLFLGWAAVRAACHHLTWEGLVPWRAADDPRCA